MRFVETLKRGICKKARLYRVFETAFYASLKTQFDLKMHVWAAQTPKQTDSINVNSFIRKLLNITKGVARKFYLEG